MLRELDQTVGHVVEALAKKGMLKDSIIVFSTDNGGPAWGFNHNAASNWPLRGVKNTLYEGQLTLIKDHLTIISSILNEASLLFKCTMECKMEYTDFPIVQLSLL